MSDELKPCPFCGATKGVYTLDEYDGLRDDNHLIEQVFCDRCKSTFESENANDGKELIAAWNTRAERTCEISSFDGGLDEAYDGSLYNYAPPTYYLSCGHNAYECEPNYCTNCGRKVV